MHVLISSSVTATGDPPSCQFSMDSIEVTEVAYGRTINTGNYQNVRIDYRAKVKPGQDPVYVMRALKLMAAEEEERVRAEEEGSSGR